jgi:carboxyl-terminal processing protease
MDSLESGVGTESHRRITRRWLVVLSACTLLGLFVGGAPSTAQNEKQKPADYPELFRDLARKLRAYYLDLDRLTPQPLMAKAFAAIENAVDDIYIENSDPANPVVTVHLDSKTEKFDLAGVKDLNGAVQMLESAFKFIGKNYHGETPLNEIRYAAANGFLSGLDPHTLVFSPEDFKDFSIHIEGEICGVGMLLGTRDGKLTVLEVLKGTPAQRAGFKKGDLIAKISDESTINMTVSEAVERIRGQCGSPVTLTVKRTSAEDPEKLDSRPIDVVRDRVEIKSVESKLIPDWNKDGTGPWKGGVGYVDVINFDKNTLTGLNRHLDLLKAANGGQPLAGLILDLRNNSGGLLTQAIDMSDLFLESGEIVITASRGDKLDIKEAETEGVEPKYPIIVLANEQSASGAEIVIGALQKNNRAIVLGTRTFGKGSVQQLHPLANDAQLKVTVSEYLIPGKISIQENGVVPDVLAQAAVDDGDIDLFPNEGSASERNYEKHIVSRYTKKESPRYTLNYLYVPPETDLYNDRFMSGELEPDKDKLVQMALSLLKLADKPYDPRKTLESRKDDILKLKESLLEEIVKHLKQKGIDWSADPSGSPSKSESGKLDLEIATRVIQEPSKEKDDHVPVNKLLITAKLTNKGDKALYRMKGLTRSEYFLYKDQELLFGKLEPGQTVEQTARVRLPYYPFARNDLVTVEVSSTGDLPAGEAAPADPVVLSKPFQIELTDSGRPAFAYSAELLDAESRKPLPALDDGTRAVLKVKVKNLGNAPVHKGIAILRNKTGRQVFLEKGRIEITNLEPQKEVEIEFTFEVRSGDPVENYDFELVAADSYSAAAISRKLAIPRKDKTGERAFTNGEEFAPPKITASLVDPETHKPVLLTGKGTVKLEALIQGPDSDRFKAWVFNSVVGDHEGPPDKILFADSSGKDPLKIDADVALKKGINLFTVVSNGKNGLESRQNLIVRRE